MAEESKSTADATNATIESVGYVFVSQASDDFATNLRSTAPTNHDPPLHFVAMTDGPFAAFAVVVAADRAAVANIVDTHFPPAGGSGFEIAFSNPPEKGPLGLRWTVH